MADSAIRALADRGRAFWWGALGPIEALLPPGTDPRRLRQMPATFCRPYVRAVRGEASPQLALRVFCAECCGRDREAVIHVLHAPDSVVRVKREVLEAAEIGNGSWR